MDTMPAGPASAGAPSAGRSRLAGSRAVRRLTGGGWAGVGRAGAGRAGAGRAVCDGKLERPAHPHPEARTDDDLHRAPSSAPTLAREGPGAWHVGTEPSRSDGHADHAGRHTHEEPGAVSDDQRDGHRQRPASAGGRAASESAGEARDGHGHGDHLDRLEGAVSNTVGLDLDPLADDELIRRLDRLRRPIARLTAERARITAELERRRVAASKEPSARQSARRDLRRQLADRANSTPAATKRDADAGRIADQHPRTGASFADGSLSADHVRLIGETLQALPPERRALAESQLLELAPAMDPTRFGKRARELLAREAPDSSDRAARDQHRQRRVRSYDTPDGGFAFSGLLYGDMAETARTALDAFRRPDTPGEHRSPEQRSADAFEQLCAASLRVGEAPARHGVRPQVIITVPADQLALGDRGVARFGSGQPTTLRQLRTLIADCTWSRVLLAPDSTPIEASKTVRTVPAGLWRILVARDAGCTWPGCDAPPTWCDVAHGAKAFTDGGQLSPSNAALLCRRHHRRFDRGGWRIDIRGSTVAYHRDGDGPQRGHTPDGSTMPTAHRSSTASTPLRGDATAPEPDRPGPAAPVGGSGIGRHPPPGEQARGHASQGRAVRRGPVAPGSSAPAREAEQQSLQLPPALADP